MSDSEFDEPQRIAINRVYTRGGDKGTTSLVGGQKVPKHALRIETYGAVDELNAFVGTARQTALEADPKHPMAATLRRVQHQLFNLGSVLATLPEDVHERQPRPRSADVDWLEADMDRCNATLEPLRSFVLPGGSRLNTDLHVTRTICRRAERLACQLADSEQVDEVAIRYLNRLSDAFFVWSRWVIAEAGAEEVLWAPNAADGSED
ncbi:MAG: cob(I)alamin adenosyltransferase [Bradymonadia bacterium]|jgi:cob(I)alamin adenosyltransferase